MGGQHPSGGTRRTLFGEGDDEVLHRHVVVLEPLSFPLGGLQQVRQPPGDRHLARRGARPAHLRAPVQLAFEVRAQCRGVGARLIKQSRYETLGLFDQRHQEMFAVDLDVTHPGRDALCFGQCLL
ncbi:hypothetical protein MTIM_49590 [Mycobacterium timonense]|uniref:Uncharacterized protein n=1 Tax=Mycobacterium timonense TaxID=701043 RepID=A0A7I9ZDJ9_9MYCO|nr:hypothetical protein MTIM_49590 [Mycobacterium timonense]